MTEQELTTLANDILRDVLAPHGFEHADMIAGSDHDGEPSLVVIAHFKSDAGVTDGAVSTKALSRLRQGLLDRGETRFPYIRYDYPGDEVLGDDVSDEDHHDVGIAGKGAPDRLPGHG
ncbi:hypothetical protein MKK70_17525 [Methylobacterium sp. E-041]|uniref:hypothetical protein n=1 Tax=unclassified Methylobacterium TaxID=2615210 RepID=UPI001FBA9D57|nr:MULTISPECIES: hypothetical protein [unclassified Methylobacterium]MCJ2078299.1 hypothetical protein [Methylobacterium sp. E-016]MCJ2107149.1 hypothetical protein [Methylobacterium sp. E-041]MCJ2111357.1 hypothetical protein [Methylobacterium sp. E-025]